MLKNPLIPMLAVLYVGMGALLIAPPTPAPAPDAASKGANIDANASLPATYFDSLPSTAAGPSSAPGDVRRTDRAVPAHAGMDGALGSGLNFRTESKVRAPETLPAPVCNTSAR